MRAKRKARAPRAALIAVGALLTLFPVALLAFGGGPADAASVARSARQARTHARHHHHRRHRRHHLHRHHTETARDLARLPVVASWYYDEGNTACGFHAEYGVANKTLPCGTKVTLRYDGHSVVATVDDRGPFVYGRTFDLDQKTAGALGMWGVATVYSSAV